MAAPVLVFNGLEKIIRLQCIYGISYNHVALFSAHAPIASHIIFGKGGNTLAF